MSILSFSLQGDTTERITAWEREIATNERGSGKILDEPFLGGILSNIPAHTFSIVRRKCVLDAALGATVQLHRGFLIAMLKKWTNFRDEVVAISRAIAVAQTQPTPMEGEIWER